VLVVFHLHDVPRVAREPDLLKGLVGVHVLVVDDDPDARDLLESVLTYCGAFVSSVVSAREALDCLEAKTIEVVIADVLLPGEEDGYWLVRAIGARGDGRSIPVVALVSGRGHGPDRTLAAGFHGHLRKPVDPWEMCRMVANLARKA
jgi:CheY-like chemotaxis protein